MTTNMIPGDAEGTRMSQEPDTRPSWYPDPLTPGVERYWDGTQWTPDTRPSSHARQPVSGKSTTSLVLGIVAVTIGWALGVVLPGGLMLPVIVGAAAAVFGHSGTKEAATYNKGGRGMAVAGLVMGYFAVGSAVLVMLVQALVS